MPVQLSMKSAQDACCSPPLPFLPAVPSSSSHFCPSIIVSVVLRRLQRTKDIYINYHCSMFMQNLAFSCVYGSG